MYKIRIEKKNEYGERYSFETVYEQIFTDKRLDSSLISGFLQAVRVFGIELTDANVETRSIKLDYQNSKILMSDYKNSRIILIMEENPSQDFLDAISALSYDIEEKFGHLLENFDGDITQFSEIRGLLDQHLPTSLVYPLKVITQTKKITPDEQIIINRAIKIMKEKNTDHFFVSSLHEKKKGFQVKDAETILNLIQKRIFNPKIAKIPNYPNKIRRQETEVRGQILDTGCWILVKNKYPAMQDGRAKR